MHQRSDAFTQLSDEEKRRLRAPCGEHNLSFGGSGRIARVIQVLGDLVVLFLPVLPLNMLHLVLEPQFQLFQPDFFQLLVISKESFLGE